ncbi:MAG TPA: anthranilate phosphoribosyltransferase [Limnochordia bacterium]
MREVLQKLLEGHDLGEDEAAAAMSRVMSGEATPAQIAAFAVALRMKGETIDEIAGCARAMREHAARIQPKRGRSGVLVDTCGTGGDGAQTFNISTAAAFVVAGCGVPVAKHGNRAASSRCGSADVLEALGIPVDLTPAAVEAAIDTVGIGFLFAPTFHPALRHAAAPRREIGVRTIFNLLGPLTNPAGANCQIVGVPDPALPPVLARVLLRLGAREVLVVHGLDGLDEISLSAPTRIARGRAGEIEEYELTPEMVGLARVDREALRGGDAHRNAEILASVLSGERGPMRDVVVLNAAAALLAAGAARDWSEGVDQAARSIDSGAAAAKLEALKAYCRQVA